MELVSAVQAMPWMVFAGVVAVVFLVPLTYAGLELVRSKDAGSRYMGFGALAVAAFIFVQVVTSAAPFLMSLLPDISIIALLP